jgi:hypothetical protein
MTINSRNKHSHENLKINFFLDHLLIIFCKILLKYRFLLVSEKIIEFYLKILKTNNSKIGILLANICSQRRDVKKEQKILKKFFNLGLIKNEDEIARIGYCSVIVKDFLFLKKLIFITKNNKILNLYLIALNKSKNFQFINFSSYIKVGNYFKKKKLTTYYNYIKLCMNFFGYNKKIKSKENNIYIKKILTSNESNKKKCFVLISCDFKFFKIFSEHYILNFRLNNNHLIHFHIISNEPKLKIINEFDRLQKIYKNLGLSIELEKKKKNIVYITLSRFIMSNKLMNYYESDVFINDIDFTPNYNLDLIFKKMSNSKCNIGLYDADQRIPWTRFAAGICYFKYKDSFSINFLSKLSGFYNYKIKYYKKLFWSSDQLGLTIVYYSMKKKLKVLNFYKYKKLFNENIVFSVPKNLAIKKIKAKFENKKFDE